MRTTMYGIHSWTSQKCTSEWESNSKRKSKLIRLSVASHARKLKNCAHRDKMKETRILMHYQRSTTRVKRRLRQTSISQLAWASCPRYSMESNWMSSMCIFATRMTTSVRIDLSQWASSLTRSTLATQRVTGLSIRQMEWDSPDTRTSKSRDFIFPFKQLLT